MGPGVKFVLAIKDSFSKKKWGLIFFLQNWTRRGGGARGLLVCSHKNYLSSFLNISLNQFNYTPTNLFIFFFFFIKKDSQIILFVWLYTLFSTHCLLYHHSLIMNIFQIQIIQKMLSNLSQPVKTSYSPFQVKQSKLCH